MLTSLISDSSAETGQYNSFISRCEMLKYKLCFSFLLNHVVSLTYEAFLYHHHNLIPGVLLYHCYVKHA
jgi:hypothetical protein